MTLLQTLIETPMPGALRTKANHFRRLACEAAAAGDLLLSVEAMKQARFYEQQIGLNPDLACLDDEPATV